MKHDKKVDHLKEISKTRDLLQTTVLDRLMLIIISSLVIVNAVLYYLQVSDVIKMTFSFILGLFGVMFLLCHLILKKDLDEEKAKFTNSIEALRKVLIKEERSSPTNVAKKVETKADSYQVGDQHEEIPESSINP